VSRWMKARPAAEFCGGISVKALYTAVRAGDLRAARIGAGRNLLFCESFLTDWLMRSAGEPVENAPSLRRVE
jgi:hypothetical protein